MHLYFNSQGSFSFNSSIQLRHDVMEASNRYNKFTKQDEEKNKRLGNKHLESNDVE